MEQTKQQTIEGTGEVFLAYNGRVLEPESPHLGRLDWIEEVVREPRWERWLVTILIHERAQDDPEAMLELLRAMVSDIEASQGAGLQQCRQAWGSERERKQHELDLKRRELSREAGQLQEALASGDGGLITACSGIVSRLLADAQKIQAVLDRLALPGGRSNA